VLLRSTGDIDVYLQALRDADVPYLVERDRSYYRRREIIDAAALVRAVVDPGDHLALVTVLRSALVGVPDAALVPLWSRSFPDRASELGAGETSLLEDLRRTVLEIARALPGDVPGIGRVAGWETNLVAFLGHLAELRVAFREEPSASFVEKLRRLTLFEIGEAARTLGAYRVANLDRFFRTLLGAMEAVADPHAVLRTLRTAVGEGREAEEGRPLIAAEDVVRVMTSCRRTRGRAAKGVRRPTLPGSETASSTRCSARSRPGGGRSRKGAAELLGRSWCARCTWP
jgi:ATP-dependent exoDNAse (exonuclease V) beta subunit